MLGSEGFEWCEGFIEDYGQSPEANYKEWERNILAEFKKCGVRGFYYGHTACTEVQIHLFPPKNEGEYTALVKWGDEFASSRGIEDSFLSWLEKRKVAA